MLATNNQSYIKPLQKLMAAWIAAGVPVVPVLQLLPPALSSTKNCHLQLSKELRY
jgi:hypothetical protein